MRPPRTTSRVSLPIATPASWPPGRSWMISSSSPSDAEFWGLTSNPVRPSDALTCNLPSGKPLSAVDVDALARDVRRQRRHQVENCVRTFVGSAEAAEGDALPERLEQLRRAEPVVEGRLDDTRRDRIDPDVA